MDPTGGMIGGALSLGGGVIGQIASANDKAAASQARVEAINAIKSLDPQQQKVIYQQLKLQGLMTPDLEQAFTLGPSAMEGVQANQQAKDAQLGALKSLQGVANSGGMTIQDQANMNKLLSQTAQQEQGKRAAILQDMDQRGKGGSGFSLAAQLLNQQQSANRANEQQTQIAADAQARALQAMQGAGSMGLNIANQDFNQQAQIAGAKDLINKFNTQNQQSVANQNVQTKNAAQQYNLNQAQDVANKNVGIANTQQDQNNNLYNQYYTNLANKQNSLSNAYTGQAQQYQQQAKDTAQMWSKLGQGAGQAFAGFSAANQSSKDGSGKNTDTNWAGDDQFGQGIGYLS